jgi:hypothetical protein
MAIRYNAQTGKYETDWGYTTGSKSTAPQVKKLTTSYDKDIERLLGDAQEAGVTIPLQKINPQPSILSRLLGALSAGETAPAAMAALEGGNPAAAYMKSVAKRATLGGMEGPTYADVLEKAGVPQGKLPIGSLRGLAGLALDIGLDPTTYIGAGLVRRVLGALSKGGKATTKIAPRVPFIGKKILEPLVEKGTKLKDTIGEAFIPYYRLKQTGAAGKQAAEMLTKLPQKIRGQSSLVSQDMVNKLIELKPKTMSADEYLSSISKGLQIPGSKVGEAEKAVSYLRGLTESIGKKEQSVGVLNDLIEGYAPRRLTKEGREFFEKSSLPEVARLKEFGIKHGPEISRKFHPDKTIEEINQQYGVKIFEENPIVAMSERIRTGVQRTETAQMFRDLVDRADELPFVSRTAKTGWSKMPEKISGFKIPGLENVYVPNELYEDLSKHISTVIDDRSTRQVANLYDKALSFWKGQVTGRFPAFHAKNFAGGVFNNFILGVKNPIRYEQAFKLWKGSDDTIKLAGKSYTFKELKNLLVGGGALEDQGYLDIVRSTSDVARDLFKNRGTVKETISKLIPGRSWMNATETQVRGAMFIDSLAKGKSVDEAIKNVFKAHFDYAPEALTGFEKKVMTRVIPFYTWMRNNVPLQITQMVRQPGKYSAIGKTMRSAKGKEEGEEVLPEYIASGFPIKTGEEEGKRSYAYSLGLPIEDVNRLVPSQMVQSLSPILKAPIEMATGQSLFYGKPLEETNYVPDFMRETLKRAPKKIQDAVDFYEYKKKDGSLIGRVNPRAWLMLSTLMGRYITTIDNVTDEQADSISKILNLFTGVKTKTFKTEDERDKRARELMSNIGKELYGRGVVSKFTNYYKPKQK